MTKQEMIEKIYERVADKTLNRWCRFMAYNRLYEVDANYFHDDDYGYCTEPWEVIQHIYKIGNIDKIIWHLVKLWDVLDYILDDEKPMIMDGIIRKWGKKRKPIEEQSEDCIKLVFNNL